MRWKQMQKKKICFLKKRAKHNQDMRIIFALKDITQKIKALGLNKRWHCYIVFVFFKNHIVHQNSLLFSPIKTLQSIFKTFQSFAISANFAEIREIRKM